MYQFSIFSQLGTTDICLIVVSGRAKVKAVVWATKSHAIIGG